MSTENFALHCKAARTLLGWSQERLASESGVAKRTIVHVELGDRGVQRETIEKLKGTLEMAGIGFIETKGEVGVTLRRSG